MAEKDPGARLRRAVKENNLFLVKRLVERTDQRNPDPNHRRYTSLCWAAVLGHEETFEFLLQNGHDQNECSRDSENNTILMLLADQNSSLTSPYSSIPTNGDAMRAVLRMARLYFDYYPKTIQWANVHGKTALHVAALKGNEELVRMLCDLGADVDLSDNQGNTPLHYASTWGHLPVVQLLIDRGCQYSARNNEGFTASDYAYSVSTRDTLQDAARLQFENKKNSRRAIYAQAATRGSELGHGGTVPPTVSPSKRIRSPIPMPRARSSSHTSRDTTSDSENESSGGLAPTPRSQSSISTSSSPSHHSYFPAAHGYSSSSATLLNPPSHANSHSSSALAQLASRVRERDADAMEKYMRRNRSESSSTDNRSANGSFTSAPSVNGDNISSLGVFPTSGSSTPRRLRPSISASQLRSQETIEPPESRTRSGTNPTQARPHNIPQQHPHPVLARSTSSSNSLRVAAQQESGSFTGPPSQYARFPDPPLPAEDNSTPTVGRRMGFPSITKVENGTHRRGLSAASFRG